MLDSVLFKGIAITLAIFGVVTLAAKMNLVTDAQEHEKVVRAEFVEKLEQRKVEGKRLNAAYDAKNKHYMFLENVARSVSGVKYTIKQHHDRHGEWPADLSEIGMQSETAADGKYSESVKISEGEIYAFLKPDYGDNKIFRMFYTGKYPNQWSCTTNLNLDGQKTVAGMPCSEDKNITFDGTYFQ